MTHEGEGWISSFAVPFFQDMSSSGLFLQSCLALYHPLQWHDPVLAPDQLNQNPGVGMGSRSFYKLLRGVFCAASLEVRWLLPGSHPACLN